MWPRGVVITAQRRRKPRHRGMMLVRQLSALHSRYSMDLLAGFLRGRAWHSDACSSRRLQRLLTTNLRLVWLVAVWRGLRIIGLRCRRYVTGARDGVTIRAN